MSVSAGKNDLVAAVCLRLLQKRKADGRMRKTARQAGKHHSKARGAEADPLWAAISEAQLLQLLKQNWSSPVSGCWQIKVGEKVGSKRPSTEEKGNEVVVFGLRNASAMLARLVEAICVQHPSTFPVLKGNPGAY